ncbi:retrovirus-related pol polyprotein from transposon TNT 1-94, partial [Tanacetum coccineum]
MDNSISNQSAPSFDQLFELNELKAQSQEKDMVIKKLKERIKSLSGNMDKDKIKQDLEEIETINIELDHRVTKLIAENEHLKQTYKQLYDSIKPARVRSKEQCADLTNQVNLKSVEISDLNACLQEKVLVITTLKDELRKLKGKDLANNEVTHHPSDPEINTEPITPKLLNKRSAHSAYIKHTQEEAAVLRDLVDHIKANYPLDPTLEYACKYTKLIQELLTKISKTCPSLNNSGEQLVAVTPMNKVKRVRFTEPVTSSRNTITKKASTSNLASNKPMLSSTGVKPSTSASGSQPSGNTKKDKIQQTQSSTQKNKVEAHPRKVKSSLKNKDHVVAPKGTAHVQHSKLNANSELKCVKCNGCMLSDNHDLCVLDYINNVNARAKSKSAKKQTKRKVWKPTGKMFTTIGYIWRPTGRTFTIVGNACPLTRITTTTEAPLRKPVVLDNETSKPAVTLVYSQKPKNSKTNVPVSKSKVLQFVSANKKEPSKSRGSIISDVPSFSLNECRSSKLSSGTVKFENDHMAKIFRYGDYQIRNATISMVYYVEGLGHNLFLIGQFCDSNLEVAFRQHTCFIHNLEGVDLLTGSRGNNLYTLSLGDMMASSPISRHGLVRGLPKLKFEKDHLCSACAMGKSKKKPHKPKSEDTNQEKLYLLHMDLCGPMRVASVNGKKSKDEASDFIIKFLKMIQLRLKVPVRRIRTDNGTEFVNQTLHEYYEKVGISHKTFVARSPQQNGVVERRNHTLIEAARTMLIYAKASLFLWAEAVATACYIQNRSIIRLHHDKTPYDLLHDKLPDLSLFHVFGALCYPTNDNIQKTSLLPPRHLLMWLFLSQVKASSSKHKPSKAQDITNADDVDLIHEDLDQIDDLDLEEMDINWQIAMTAIKIKKFYKKTGRRPRVDGKMHVAFDKRKVECFNCHNTGHFARECKFKGSKEGSRQEAGRGQDFKPVRTEKEALMTIDEGQINWVEQTTDEELNHALMAFTVNNEVSMCSKLCLDSYNALQAKYDELQSEFGDQEAALTAHKLAVKKLESQLRASHKQQSSLTEKLNFQANQIFEKDEKLKKYRRIGMKAVKDKDALQKIVDSWFASSKNLWKLIDCGMSSTVKIGLGYGIQSNAEVLGYEEEISRGIFALRETDAGYYDIPLYSRFKQVEYKGVPHPLSGDYTPREQEDIDDSLYEYGKYGPQPQSPSPTVSDASSTVYSTCPSNDSDGELGAVSDHSVNDDPIHDHIPIPSIEQVTIATQKTQPQVPKPKQIVVPSCAQHVKTPRQPIRTPVTPSPILSNNKQNWNQQMERELGAGYSFERKTCFVCGSLSHLIKDCDYYEKKMAREAALKSQRVVHANVRQATPAWTNTNKVNKANQVNVNTGKQNVNYGSMHVNSGTQIKYGSSRFNTGKQNVDSGSVHVNTARVNRSVSNQTSNKTSTKFSQ